MSTLLVWKTIRKELLSFSSLVIIFISSVLYIYFAAFLINYKAILAPNTALLYKLTLLWTFGLGMWDNLTILDTILFVLSFLLVGLNILLFYKTVHIMTHKGKVRLSIGGGTVLALATTGCMSCGVSILSILGLSASLSFLPFRGLELHLFAILLLLISSSYMFWHLYKTKYCVA